LSSPFANHPDKAAASAKDTLESKKEDIASALYYDPKERVIYEVLTDEE